jgi:hypothetical protein
MSKRMKLVPESLYNKFMQVDESREDQLKESKKSVLDQDIPNEIKAVLYQDFLRTLHRKRQIDEATPVLVKSVTDAENLPSSAIEEEDETPIKHRSYSKREEALITHLTTNGVKLSDKRELIVNGKLIKKSNIDKILSALADPFGREVKAKGFANMLGVLRLNKAPITVLPPQYQHLLQSRARRQQTGKGIKLNWTSYHK